MAMKIPFGTFTVTETAKRLIIEAVEAGRLSSGKYVRIFEEKYAAHVGAKEAVAVSSGTDADALALAVLYDFGASRGDEVILPALSFVATGNAVLQAGLMPVFVDVDQHTLNMDPSKIEAAITPRTRAIMPVHLMGKPADMDPIMAIAGRHGLYVVEDAAEAHGALYRGRPIGTIGHMAAYSLYVAHIISTVEGGVITTDSAEFAEIVRSLRSHGRACKCRKCVLNIASGYCEKRFKDKDRGDIRFIFERIGFSAKMNELEAAVGLGTLEIYDDILAKRYDNLKYMMAGMERFSEHLYTLKEEPYEKLGPHALPIILRKGAPFTRDELVAHLEAGGIDTRDLFASMPTQCAGYRFMGHRLGEFPNAEHLGDHGLHIGCHQDMGRAECDYFIEVTADFLKKRA